MTSRAPCRAHRLQPHLSRSLFSLSLFGPLRALCVTVRASDGAVGMWDGSPEKQATQRHSFLRGLQPPPDFILEYIFFFHDSLPILFWDEKEGALVLVTVRWPRFLSHLPLPLVFWCLNRARAGLPSRRYTFYFCSGACEPKWLLKLCGVIVFSVKRRNKKSGRDTA